MSVKTSTGTRSIGDEINETVTVTVRVTSKESGGLLELVTEKLVSTSCVIRVSVDSVKQIEPKNGYTNVTATVTLTHQITGETSDSLTDKLGERVCVDLI